MTRPTFDDIQERAEEFADAFLIYDPKPGDGEAPLPPAMGVMLAAWRRDVAEQELAEAVRSARARRLSWRAVGEAIGTSGEAARQRYSKVSAEDHDLDAGAEGAVSSSVGPSAAHG